MSVIFWKRAFLIWLPLSLVFIFWLLYVHIDLAISHSYLQQNYGEVTSDFSRLTKIFPKDRYKKKDIVYILRQQDPDALIVEDKCSVAVNGLYFAFSTSGELIDINPYEQHWQKPTCGS